MSGLTPEQIQEGKRLIESAQASWSDTRVDIRDWRGIQADLNVWLFTNASALLAAAESVGKLEQQLAEVNGYCAESNRLLVESDEENASLRAQLAAREQERDEAREIARERIDLAVTNYTTSGDSRCSACGAVGLAGAKIQHDKACSVAIVRSWSDLAPYVPPQTTETRG